MSEFKTATDQACAMITREMMQHDAATMSAVAIALLVAIVALMTVRYMYLTLTK